MLTAYLRCYHFPLSNRGEKSGASVGLRDWLSIGHPQIERATRALEDAGVIFIDEDEEGSGVRLRKSRND
jgi:DNA-binding PadR family transcriptional regulator